MGSPYKLLSNRHIWDSSLILACHGILRFPLNVCKKMLYYLYLIKSHYNVLKFDVMKLLIESLVFSHLSYSISVWGVSLKQHLEKCLECLQNRAVHLLFHLQKFDHVTSYYRRVSWLPSNLIKYHSVLCFINFVDMAEVFHWSPLFSLAGLLITTPQLNFFSHIVWGVVCRLLCHFFSVKPLIDWWNLLASDIKSHVQFSDFKNNLFFAYIVMCFMCIMFVVICRYFLCIVCMLYAIILIVLCVHWMFLYVIIACTYVCIPVRKDGSSRVLWLWINQSNLIIF